MKIESEPKFDNSGLKDKKREFKISRIAGVSLEQEEEIIELLEDSSDQLKDIPQLYSKEGIEIFEREKSEEELSLIETILKNIPGFIKKYDGKPLDMQPENFHFLETKSHDKDGSEKKYASLPAGFHLPGTTFIGILPQRNRYAKAFTLIHEALHSNAFYSLTYSEVDTKKKFIPRRAGFKIFRRKTGEEYFDMIDEAIIEKLTIRFFDKYIEFDPAFAVSIELDSDNDEHAKTEAACSPNVEIIDKITEVIYRKNKADFESKDQVFDIFAHAVMTGNILPAARLIKKTYGNRTSFAEFGELTKK